MKPQSSPACPLVCMTCGRVCTMRTAAARDLQSGESVIVVPVLLHACLQCGERQVFTVRKPDGSLHRVSVARPGKPN